MVISKLFLLSVLHSVVVWALCSYTLNVLSLSSQLIFPLNTGGQKELIQTCLSDPKRLYFSKSSNSRGQCHVSVWSGWVYMEWIQLHANCQTKYKLDRQARKHRALCIQDLLSLFCKLLPEKSSVKNTFRKSSFFFCFHWCCFHPWLPRVGEDESTHLPRIY